MTPTILHEVCNYGKVQMFSHICGHDDIFVRSYASDVFILQKRFFSFLHELVADPRIVVMGKSD